MLFRSKKHGGADLGPTRAKRAWAELGVDGIGVADYAPQPSDSPTLRPRLTCEMVTRLQGWRDEWGWRFSGRLLQRSAPRMACRASSEKRWPAIWA